MSVNIMVRKTIKFTMVFVFGSWASLSYTAMMSDPSLSESKISNPNLTQDLISIVKDSVKQPIEVQNQEQKSLAQNQSDQFKQYFLETSAVSDYELKKKVESDDLNLHQKIENLIPRHVRPAYLYYDNNNIIIKVEYPDNKNLRE